MRPPTIELRIQSLIHRHVLLQVALVALLWVAGEGVVRATQLPVPGGLIGLALLLAMLTTSRVDAGLFSRGAHWLIGEMLLFFVPAVMAITQHRELLGDMGLKLLGVIVVGTVLVMTGTALVVDACVTLRHRHAAR